MRRRAGESPNPLWAVPFLLPLAAMAIIIGCGEEATTVDDAVPPARVTNLTVAFVTDTSAALTWRAPGDDGIEGTASEYDIRYSRTNITEQSWGSATGATSEPEPQEGGTQESFAVTGLEQGTSYFFALKTADEVPNWSYLSNVASGTTSTPDTIPPLRVTDLRVTAVTDSTISLAWTTPSDPMRVEGLAQYDIRYSQQEINEETWETAEQADDEPPPGEPGSEETFTLVDLAAGTTYFIALRTLDTAQNVSELSNVAQGQTRAPFVVNPDGTGDFATIQDAIDAIPQGSVIELIDGSFRGNGNRDLNFGGKSLTLRSQSGNPEDCILNCEGTDSNPHRGFLFTSGEQTSTIVQGITIFAGLAGEGNEPLDGGGALCLGGSSPSFINCIFSGCTAGGGGGAVFVNGGDAVFEQCTFSNNDGGVGGAVRIESSSPTLTGCTFSSNQAFTGGGLSFSGSFLTLGSCNFNENSADEVGGAIHIESDAFLELSNCGLSGNVAAEGGAIGMDFGDARAVLTAVDCTFNENSSGHGGAVLMSGSSLSFTRCDLLGNHGTGVVGIGGAIAILDHSNLTMSYCTLSANLSDRGAGAISLNQSSCNLINSVLTGNRSHESAGALYALQSTVESDMCSFASNWAGTLGGGIYLESSEAFLERSILWGNCAVEGGAAAFLSSAAGKAQLGLLCCAVDSAGMGGDENVNYLGPQVFSDPLFCNPQSCDAAPTTSGDYRLQDQSPCTAENSPCLAPIGARAQGCD